MKYHLLSFLLKSFSLLPLCVLYDVADVMALLLYYVVRYRRKMVRRNLATSFPDKTAAEIKKIEKGFYRFFADNIVETVKLATMSPEQMKRRMRFTNVEDINRRALEGHSVALFLGHYANWEWISSIPLYLDKSIFGGQIYHQLRNKAVNRVMLNLRSRMGSANIDMHDTARCITRLVSQKQTFVIGFIADQSPRYKEVRYFFPFLNHDTPALVGTEKLVDHYNLDAWFVRPRRVKRGYYETEFIHMPVNGDEKADFGLTAEYYRMLQNMIEACPQFYLWSHNRFKYARPLQH